MKSRYYYINLTDQERVDILHSLINKRNKLIEQHQYPRKDCGTEEKRSNIAGITVEIL